jgi:hypothetical protein
VLYVSGHKGAVYLGQSFNDAGSLLLHCLSSVEHLTASNGCYAAGHVRDAPYVAPVQVPVVTVYCETAKFATVDNGCLLIRHTHVCAHQLACVSNEHKYSGM